MSPIPYQISDNIPGERGQEDESDEEEDEVTRKEVVEDEDEEEISLAYEDNIDIIPSEENSQSQVFHFQLFLDLIIILFKFQNYLYLLD